MVLFADRISTKRTTGYSPFELILRLSPVLLVDLELEAYLGIDWEKVVTTEDLLEARVKQLENRDVVLQEAYSKQQDSRQQSVDYWNSKKKLREPLAKGQLVLVYNKSLDSQWGKLFENKWNGPYRIKTQNPGGSYSLEELDGTEIIRNFASSQVKPYYSRK